MNDEEFLKQFFTLLDQPRTPEQRQQMESLILTQLRQVMTELDAEDGQDS